MIWKTEHGGENPDFDFLLLFTEKPFILRPVSVVAASCFSYIGPWKWFYFVLGGFLDCFGIAGKEGVTFFRSGG